MSDPDGTVSGWPDPLGEAAYYGLAGDIVRVIAPHTEAAREALLLQFLVAFGNVIGRTAHFIADGATHYLNLFLVLLGVTSKGRKGTAWAHIRRLFETLDPTWVTDRVQTGLSSGEGLVWCVRDPIHQKKPVIRKGQVSHYVDVVVDEGEADKRALIVEEEFSSPLRSAGRDGNTLSAKIRDAWGLGNLQLLTKNNRAKATNAHISIVGHVTRDELRKYLPDIEIASGFGNRFLFACVKRARILPHGGAVPEQDLAPLVKRLVEAVAFAVERTTTPRGREARALWESVYPTLSAGKPGLLGALTGRAEAQAARLERVYAMLDRAQETTTAHLEAALAITKYVEASCRFVFGDVVGDRTADEILRALRGATPHLSRTQIMDLFDRNKGRHEIGRALGVLLEHGLVETFTESITGPGRPTEYWRAIR
jgi:hypothetical protein